MIEKPLNQEVKRLDRFDQKEDDRIVVDDVDYGEAYLDRVNMMQNKICDAKIDDPELKEHYLQSILDFLKTVSPENIAELEEQMHGLLDDLEDKIMAREGKGKDQKEEPMEEGMKEVMEVLMMQEKSRQKAIGLLQLDSVRDQIILKELEDESYRQAILGHSKAEIWYKRWADAASLGYLKTKTFIDGAENRIEKLRERQILRDELVKILQEHRANTLNEAVGVLEKEGKEKICRRNNPITGQETEYTLNISEALKDWKEYGAVMKKTGWGIDALELDQTLPAENIGQIALGREEHLRSSALYQEGKQLLLGLLGDEMEKNIIDDVEKTKIEQAVKEKKSKEELKKSLMRRKEEMKDVLRDELMKNGTAVKDEELEEIITKQIKEKSEAYEQSLIEEQVRKAAFQKMDPDELKSDKVKREAYRRLSQNYDLGDRWWVVSDETANKVMSTIIIDGGMIALSGGIAGGVKKAVVEGMGKKIGNRALLTVAELGIEGAAFHTAMSGLQTLSAGSEAWDNYWKGVAHSIGMFGAIKGGKMVWNKAGRDLLALRYGTGKMTKLGDMTVKELTSSGELLSYMGDLATEVTAFTSYDISLELVHDLVTGENIEISAGKFLEKSGDNLAMILELRIGGKLFGPMVQKSLMKMGERGSKLWKKIEEKRKIIGEKMKRSKTVMGESVIKEEPDLVQKKIAMKIMEEIDFETQNLEDLGKLMRQKEEILKKVDQKQTLSPYEQKVYDRRFEIRDKYDLERVLQGGDIKQIYDIERAMDTLFAKRVYEKSKKALNDIYNGAIDENYTYFFDNSKKYSFNIFSGREFHHPTREIESESLSDECKKKIEDVLDNYTRKIFPKDETRRNLEKDRLFQLIETYVLQDDLSEANFLSPELNIKRSDFRQIKLTQSAIIRLNNFIAQNFFSESLRRSIDMSDLETIANTMLIADTEKIAKMIYSDSALLERLQIRRKHLLDDLDILQGQFAIVSGTQESTHLFISDSLKKGKHLHVPVNYEKYRGLYNCNAGVIAFVAKDGHIYIGKNTLEAEKSLQAAGYTRGFFSVPHSNDGGDWMRRNFERQLKLTEKFQTKSISVEDYNNIFDSDVIHILNTEGTGVSHYRAISDLPETIENMLQNIDQNPNIVLSASSLPRAHQIDSRHTVFFNKGAPFGIRVKKGVITEFHSNDIGSIKEGRDASLEKMGNGEMIGDHYVNRSQKIYENGYDEVFVQPDKYDLWFQLSEIDRPFSQDALNNKKLVNTVYKLNEYAERHNIAISILENGIFKEVCFLEKQIDLTKITMEEGNWLFPRENAYYLFDDQAFVQIGLPTDRIIPFLRNYLEKNGDRLILKSEMNKNCKYINSEKINLLLPFEKSLIKERIP